MTKQPQRRCQGATQGSPLSDGGLGWRVEWLQLAAEGLMSLPTCLITVGLEGSPPAEPVLCHQVPGVSTYCGRMQLSRSQPSCVRREQQEALGERRQGFEVSSATSSQPEPLRKPHSNQGDTGSGQEGRVEVGGWASLFIQTRAEEMNRFNKIMSQESKL